MDRLVIWRWLSAEAKCVIGHDQYYDRVSSLKLGGRASFEMSPGQPNIKFPLCACLPLQKFSFYSV